MDSVCVACGGDKVERDSCCPQCGAVTYPRIYAPTRAASRLLATSRFLSTIFLFIGLVGFFMGVTGLMPHRLEVYVTDRGMYPTQYPLFVGFVSGSLSAVMYYLHDRLKHGKMT